MFHGRRCRRLNASVMRFLRLSSSAPYLAFNSERSARTILSGTSPWYTMASRTPPNETPGWTISSMSRAPVDDHFEPFTIRYAGFEPNPNTERADPAPRERVQMDHMRVA